MRKSKENKKQRIIRKGNGKEPTVIEFNLSKAVIMLIIIGVIIAGIVTKEIVTTIIETNHEKQLANEDIINGKNGTENETIQNVVKKQNENLTDGEELQIVRSINGDLGYISSVDTKEVKTGTGPFDENDEPGNDSSENNEIVRSFDQITWTYELTFRLKEPNGEINLKGGTILVTAEIPEELANIVEWDIDSMSWIEEVEVNNNKNILSGKYIMNEEEITIPGKKNIIFVLKVRNALNGTKIQPKFTFMLDGNEEEEKKEVIAPKEIKVSAKGKYNIKLGDNTFILADKTTVNYEGREVSGRMYGYGFAAQLYSEDYSKGLKGIEYSNGIINFDINLNMKSVDSNSIEEDITNIVKPILWNYNENGDMLIGNIIDRDMYYGNNDRKVYFANFPRWQNKGKINIIQEDNVLHVTIDIDDKEYVNLTEDSNFGIFCSGYIQIFVPSIKDIDTQNKEYYLTVLDNNMNIVSNSGEIVTVQGSITDDEIITRYEEVRKGTYNQRLHIFKDDIDLETSYGKGDSKAIIGDSIDIVTKAIIGMSGDYDIESINLFIKFDGDAFEPIYYKDGGKYKTRRMDGNAEFKVWYVTKPNGENWTSQDEMNETNIENMDIYELIENIPNNKKCIGIYFENISGYLSRISGENNEIIFPVKVKESAKIGNTYGFTLRKKYWKDFLDRDEYTITNKDINWPEPEYDSGNLPYVKTEYNESGQIIINTNKIGPNYGNSVLILGANLHGNIKAIDNNYEEKINYNLDKNENIVKYMITPILDVNENLISQIENITLKAEVILPNGLSYKKESGKIGSIKFEPTKILNSETDVTLREGETKLIWYIEGVTSGQIIEPIEFEVNIASNSKNQQQYITTFIVSEDIEKDGITKLGNSEILNRTSTETITIINLASFRLFKEVDPPIIEKNGEMHFRITFKSNSNVELPDFMLLDIMPYNGDLRGTKYNGTYTIKNIKINQNINGVETDNSNIKFYYTQDDKVKEMNIKDLNNESFEARIWKEVIENTQTKTYDLNIKQENSGITGIVLKGKLEKLAEVIVDIYIQTENNEGEDKYVNSVTGQTDIETEEIKSSEGVIQVIERIISGKVWIDKNYNDIIDINENLGDLIENNKNLEDETIKEIILTLYKENEANILTQVQDENGNIMQVNPNGYGYYEFKGLPMGKYVVKLEYDCKKYKLVEKEVQNNKEITSKFEEGREETKLIGKTEIITTLNNNNNLRLEESNINAGLKEKINLEFTKVAEEDHTDKIGGTEFKLYKLVCTEHEEGYHDTELIKSQNVKKIANDEIENSEDETNNTQNSLKKARNTKNAESPESSSNTNNTKNTDNTNSTENLQSCWQLVDTQTSKIAITNENQGTVKFEDLEINQEYRLVETKASINRIKPEGQWKIEFSLIDEAEMQENANLIKEEIQENTKNIETQENNTESETSDTEQNKEITKINNEVEIKIQSIGNIEPPAFVITKNEETGIIEELLLPNRAYFQFPASGSIGSRTIIQIGCLVFSIGTILLINILINRKLKIRNKNK